MPEQFKIIENKKMSEKNEMTAESLYQVTLREVTNNDLQEIDPDFYTYISNFIGKLRGENYDGAESKINNNLIGLITELATLVLRIRIEKIKDSTVNIKKLLDIEEFILTSEDETKEREEMILSGILNGKSKLLESIAQKTKTQLVSVRILKEVEQMIGSDSENYGPFKPEDIATIPLENAQRLITENLAVKIRIEK
jgi:DNA replication factor GINS